MAIKNRTYAALLAGAGSLAIVCQLNPATRAADEVIESVEAEVVEAEVVEAEVVEAEVVEAEVVEAEVVSESEAEPAKELTEEQRQMLGMMKEKHQRFNETLKREIVELKEKVAAKERELFVALGDGRTDDVARLEAELKEVQSHVDKLSDHRVQAEIEFLDSIARKMHPGEPMDVAASERERRRSEEERDLEHQRLAQERNRFEGLAKKLKHAIANAREEGRVEDEQALLRELEELNRHRAGNPDSERQRDRIQLLHEFGEKLSGAGFPDIAHELHRRAEMLSAEVQRTQAEHRRHEPSNAEIAEQVAGLRAEVRELHEKVDLLLKRLAE